MLKMDRSISFEEKMRRVEEVMLEVCKFKRLFQYNHNLMVLIISKAEFKKMRRCCDWLCYFKHQRHFRWRT